MFVVGGAAMALGYDSERYTVDIDALVLNGHSAVTEAVHEVARRRGLLSSWFNENASSFMSQVRDPKPLVVFDHPALRVFAASPEHLLAMKMLAARPSDMENIRTLLDILSIATKSQAIDTFERFFPRDELNQRAQMALDPLFPSSDE